MKKILLLVALGAASAARGAAGEGGIEGTVVDGGKAVAGALVAAVAPQQYQPAAVTRSDGQGRFRLPPLAPGKYGVTATAAGHTAGMALGMVVTAGGTTRVEVKLGGDATVVSGSVVDDSTGEPLEGAALTAARQSDDDGDLFVVDVVKGRFRVALPRAGYALTVTGPGHHELHRELPAPPTAELTLRLLRSWPAGPAPLAVVDWLRAHAVALATVEAGHGFADLQPLAAAIGDARVVGLGEATHGTREFFQLKHRLLEWLVTERGFDVFAIEATMPEGFDVNEYVLTGRGDLRKALAGLYFWTWDTEEVLDLIRWMRRWNEDPKHHRLKFYGVDIQSPSRALKVASEYVARLAPTEVAALIEPLSALVNPLDAEVAARGPVPEKLRLAKAARALVARFDAARADWSARSSPEAWALARQHARVLEQYTESSFVDMNAGAALRDRAMAENVRWILEREGAKSKVVLWAHNGHVSRGHTAFSPMGRLLDAALGKSYVNVGLAFDHGSFRSRDADEGGRLHPFTVGSLPPGTVAATLHATGLPRLVIDLRRPPAGIVAEWLHARHEQHEYGSSYSVKWPVTGSPVVPAREFDLLAFVDETATARGLPGGAAIPPPVLPAPRNLDFEEHDGDQVRDWTMSRVGGLGWAATSSTEAPSRGARCALLGRVPGPRYGETSGEIAQRVDATAFRGKRVRLGGAVRASVRGPGSSARLVLRTTSTAMASQPSAANVMREDPIVAADWRRYAIELAVPANAVTLQIGVAVVGEGSACFDDLKLEVVPAVR